MGQNFVEVTLHFVWATSDRLLLIELDMERELYRYIRAVCRNDKCEVLAIGGMPDHVHLLVTFGTTVSISELMRHVKGGSSRFVSELCALEFGFSGRQAMVYSLSSRKTERS